jgi:hypothetical protein
LCAVRSFLDKSVGCSGAPLLPWSEHGYVIGGMWAWVRLIGLLTVHSAYLLVALSLVNRIRSEDDA